MKYKLTSEEYVHGGTQKDHYNESDVVSWSCPLCDSAQKKNIYKERGNLGVVECNDCGLIYTSPRAADSETNYFGDANIFFEEARLIFLNKKPHHRDRNYEYELEKIQQIKRSGKLLDIGTNMGFFLRKAKQFGYDVYGVEPSPSLAKIAVDNFKLNIANAFFSSSIFSDKIFDIVTLIDVLEHVTEPQKMLGEIHKVLKDDGIVCVKVPNGDYNKLKLKLAKFFRREEQHDIFNAYEHVVHYTPGTMKSMLEKNGFRIKKMILPLPIHPPIWASLVGHYFQYPSPFILDWKRILVRNLFYYIGKMERALGMKIEFAPDLMFIAEKK